MGLTDRAAFYYSGFLLPEVHQINNEDDAPVKERILTILLWNPSRGFLQSADCANMLPIPLLCHPSSPRDSAEESDPSFCTLKCHTTFREGGRGRLGYWRSYQRKIMINLPLRGLLTITNGKDWRL